MRTNLKNLSTLLVVWLFVALGCGSSSKGTDDADAPKVERGRLRFAKSATDIHDGRTPIYRNVRQRLFVDGKEWSPAGEKDFANKLNWCDTSPNPKVEILRCFGDASEGYKTTYILLMKNDKPELRKLDEGVGSIWIDDDGRWLLFRKFYFNVETGEKIPVKGMPFADDEYGSAPVQYVIGVSPDMKTIVAMPDNSPQREGAEEFLTLWIVDGETGKLEKRKVSYTKNPWLTNHQDPVKDIQPPPAPSKKIVWEKDRQGKDQPVFRK